jgi:hypothetical protein
MDKEDGWLACGPWVVAAIKGRPGPPHGPCCGARSAQVWAMSMEGVDQLGAQKKAKTSRRRSTVTEIAHEPVGICIH